MNERDSSRHTARLKENDSLHEGSALLPPPNTTLTTTRLAVIALGSNLGESAATLTAGAGELAASPEVVQLALSSIYTTKPAGVTEQPNFKNAVQLIETTLSPLELLHLLQKVETAFGRVREGNGFMPNGPRTLDLDLIDYEGCVMDTPELTLPHPRALLRDFVVTPLLEVSPHHVLANQAVVNQNAVECGAVIDVMANKGAVREHTRHRRDTSQHAHAPLQDMPGKTPCMPQEGVSLTHTHSKGCLSVCATPIGNLADITLRVLETLQNADAIYCEDTRVTHKLTARYKIATPLRRADAHKLPELLPQILAELGAGKHLAYVSDAGMPTISDPGSLLVAKVREADYTVAVLPGASALTTALAASGLKAHNHYFGGFLPRKAGALTRLLEELGSLKDSTLVFYESVHRTAKSLALIAEVFPTRQVVMARELTKLHEEIASGLAPELAQTIAERTATGRPLKGEVVILIAPPEPPV